jgi:hypothetical protein
MKAISTIAASLALFAFTAPHAQSDGKSVLIGVGTASCGQYLELRAKHSSYINDSFEGWLGGFASGMNHARLADTGRLKLLPDGPSMLAYVDKFCRENPLKSVFIGADALFAELPESGEPTGQ